VNPFPHGATLLQKYRIDRFKRRKDGVLLYEGADTSHARRVSIKMLERAAASDAVKCARFHEEAHGTNVIDLGTCDGLPYFVSTECELAPPPPKLSTLPPRPSKPPSKTPPPPLPKPPSSKPPSLPPPLPKRKPPVPDIPIFLDDDAILVSSPPPLPKLPVVPPAPISSDIPTTFETNPFERKRAAWPFLIVAMASIAGLAGWYVGRTTSEIAPASAPETYVTEAPIAPEPKPSAPPVVQTITSATAPVESASAPQPTPSSKPRHRPAYDPITL